MKTKQLISNFLSTAGFCIFLTSLSTDRLMAFPVPVGAGFTFTSDDLSVKIGPYNLDLEKRDPNTGVIIEKYHEYIGPGGKVLDSKKKGGKFTVDSIEGDPLAILSGPINTGSGTIEIISPDSPNLFPSVTVNISLVSGFLEAGITLPGDQLSGPDGNDTFINYTTTWQSFEPVGRIIENGNEYDLVLGTFQHAH